MTASVFDTESQPPTPVFVGVNYVRSNGLTVLDVYPDRLPSVEEGRAYIPQDQIAYAIYDHNIAGGISVPEAIRRARVGAWRPV